MKHIARVTIMFEAPTDEAHTVLETILEGTAWSYVSIDGAQTQPMIVPEPSLDEIFDEALGDE
jgi:hypothetical protein